MAENKTNELGRSIFKKIIGIGFSATLALSSCIILYDPDVLFGACIVFPFYLVLFGLHALWIDSVSRNIVVVSLFWILPFALGFVLRYCRFGNWNEALGDLSVLPLAIILALFGVHLLCQIYAVRCVRKWRQGE